MSPPIRRVEPSPMIPLARLTSTILPSAMAVDGGAALDRRVSAEPGRRAAADEHRELAAPAQPPYRLLHAAPALRRGHVVGHDIEPCRHHGRPRACRHDTAAPARQARGVRTAASGKTTGSWYALRQGCSLVHAASATPGAETPGEQRCLRGLRGAGNGSDASGANSPSTRQLLTACRVSSMLEAEFQSVNDGQ